LSEGGHPTPPAFVVFGDDWGRHVSTLQHLFGRIAQQTHVIWINSIGQREPSFADLRRAWQKLVAMVRRRDRSAPAAGRGRTAPPQQIIEPRVLPWHGNRFASALNRVSLKRDIRAALKRAAIRDGDFVMITGSPPSAPVIGECGERFSIYFCMDDFLLLPGTSPRMIGPLEQELLRRVDAVVATAQRLVETKVCATGVGFHLPQGVNYQHFATDQAVPAELRDLPRPIIGFAGGVGPAVHVETLHAISTAIPHGSVVLVGPVTLPRESLRAPNIHVFGPRPYEELPAYVQAFDVGIIPYIENDWTRTVDSLKLLEYLAAGIPVVASPLPEMRKHSGAILSADLGASFAAAVKRNLESSGSARGAAARAYAARHSWEHRAEALLGIVADLWTKSDGDVDRRGQSSGKVDGPLRSPVSHGR
jgi:glycosyltransferase involved in cell wall biosynthesis